MKTDPKSSSSKAVGQQLSDLAEYELPEWLQREQDEAREREAIDRAKLGVAVLVIVLASLTAMSAIANYAGGGA